MNRLLLEMRKPSDWESVARFFYRNALAINLILWFVVW